VSTATYYELQRSTSPSSGYADVANCSVAADAKNLDTPWVSKVCRDNNGGNPNPLLLAGTPYYYRVRACNSTPCTGTYTTTAPSNTPVTCNCSQGSTSSQIPPMRGLHPPATIPNLLTSTVTPGATFDPTLNEVAAYPTTGITHRNILAVFLPGSDETCNRGPLLYTAQNLGFDVICVNYENRYQQDNICVGLPGCFGNISQAKLDATGPCSSSATATQTLCGTVPGTTNQPYILSNAADAVTERISTMLQYLNNNGYNANGTNWGNYLSGSAPKWASIILAGHSQGGDMATFAAYKKVIARAINLSAPPQATLVNNVMTAATYFSSTKMTPIRDIFGLVSVNDALYNQLQGVPPTSVFKAVWPALGFTSANNDAEYKLNTATPVALTCTPGTSTNFSTSASVSPGGGHADPTYIWNEDVFEYMLID